MRTNVELITPEMAKEYLTRNKQNRKLNDGIVSFYAKQMRENMWALTGQGISFDSSNMLIDGQHRLAAIVLSKKPVNMLVIRGVEKTNFEFYDIGKNRSIGDIFSIDNIPNANYVVSIIGVYIVLKRHGLVSSSGQKLKARNVSAHDVKEIYYQNPKFWQDAVKLSINCSSKLNLIAKSIIGGFTASLVLDYGFDIETVTDYFHQLFTKKIDVYKTTVSFREFILKNKLSYKKIEAKAMTAFLFYNFDAFLRGNSYFRPSSLDLKERPSRFIKLNF